MVWFKAATKWKQADCVRASVKVPEGRLDIPLAGKNAVGYQGSQGPVGRQARPKFLVQCQNDGNAG
jgi:hypothetical protein